jgi:hypothetical protein
VQRLRQARFNTIGIRSHKRFPDDDPLRIPQRPASGPDIVFSYTLNFLHLAGLPLVSQMNALMLRWGMYFGIGSLMSNVLGDDLAFEKILSVSERPEYVASRLVADGMRRILANVELVH